MAAFRLFLPSVPLLLQPNLARLDDAHHAWLLRALSDEQLELLVEETGGFSGAVRPEQRVLSLELDRRAAEADRAAMESIPDHPAVLPRRPTKPNGMNGGGSDGW